MLYNGCLFKIYNIRLSTDLDCAVCRELGLLRVLPEAAGVLGAQEYAVAGVEAGPEAVADQAGALQIVPVFAQLGPAVVNCLHCGVNLEDYVSIKSSFYKLEHRILSYRSWIIIMDSLPQSCPSPEGP